MILGRKRRRRLPKGWAKGLEDLPEVHESVSPRKGSRPRKNQEPIVVTDDWPEQVPITDAELRVIEA